MGTVQVRNLDQPDETRSFPNGAETRVGSCDGYVIQPGQDARVVGDEPWVAVDFSQAMAYYANPGGAA